MTWTRMPTMAGQVGCVAECAFPGVGGQRTGTRPCPARVSACARVFLGAGTEHGGGEQLLCPEVLAGTHTGGGGGFQPIPVFFWSSVLILELG